MSFSDNSWPIDRNPLPQGLDSFFEESIRDKKAREFLTTQLRNLATFEGWETQTRTELQKERQLGNLRPPGERQITKALSGRKVQKLLANDERFKAAAFTLLNILGGPAVPQPPFWKRCF